MSPQNYFTPAENLRMFNALTREQMEELVDQSERLALVEGIEGHIIDANAQWPEEGFLSEVTVALVEVISSMRSNSKHKEALQNITAKLEDIGQCVFYATDYGRSELNKALAALDK